MKQTKCGKKCLCCDAINWEASDIVLKSGCTIRDAKRIARNYKLKFGDVLEFRVKK